MGEGLARRTAPQRTYDPTPLRTTPRLYSTFGRLGHIHAISYCALFLLPPLPHIDNMCVTPTVLARGFGIVFFGGGVGHFCLFIVLSRFPCCGLLNIQSTRCGNERRLNFGPTCLPTRHQRMYGPSWLLFDVTLKGAQSFSQFVPRIKVGHFQTMKFPCSK